MKFPSYPIISKVTFFFSITLISIALISFFWTLITIGKFYIDISSQGWADFLNYYSPQIKIAGVGLALFAIWMTAERMKQTQTQIEGITENNKFNNYYKHRSLYNEFLSKAEIISIIKRYSDVPVEQLISTYYRFFYEINYKNFSGDFSNKGN